MDAGTKAQEALSSLRELLATRSTRDVAGVLLEMCMRRANDLDFQGELMSPARQGDVLLTQLLSTTEPTDPRPFEATDWSRTIDLLNEAFGVYMELFWPDAEELPNLSEEWKHVREVAMPAFLHYFNTGLIANPEQVRTRIASYLIPFDRAFANAGLLSATDALRIADWVGARLQRALDSLNAVMDEVQKARDLAMKRVSSLEAARKLVQEKFPGLGDRLTRALDEYGTVSKSELVTEFGQLGESYWVQFSIGRGEAQALTYPTEAAAVSKRPLIRLHDDRAMVPSVNSVWTAIVESGEELLSQPATRDRYFSHRDQMLEVEAAREIKRILSPGAQVIEGSFEYSDSRGEHDVIVVDGDTALIVEAKASPPPEPFRDPEKAFTRLHRAFRADRGIQKGFEQAESIRSRLERGDVVVLYDRRGKEVATLDPTTIKPVFGRGHQR